MIFSHMKSLFSRYDYYLHTRPLMTKCITSGILFGIGDGIAQYIEPMDVYNYNRTIRMMIWGGVMFPPIGHIWYNILDKIISGYGKQVIVKKILADQLIFTPPCTLAFFLSNDLMIGSTIDHALHESNTKLFPTLIVNWTVWPLIHTITFGFIPLKYRILFINVMSLGWSTFLSITASRNDAELKYDRT